MSQSKIPIKNSFHHAPFLSCSHYADSISKLRQVVTLLILIMHRYDLLFFFLTCSHQTFLIVFKYTDWTWTSNLLLDTFVHVQSGWMSNSKSFSFIFALHFRHKESFYCAVNFLSFFFLCRLFMLISFLCFLFSFRTVRMVFLIPSTHSHIIRI